MDVKTDKPKKGPLIQVVGDETNGKVDSDEEEDVEIDWHFHQTFPEEIVFELGNNFIES